MSKKLREMKVMGMTLKTIISILTIAGFLVTAVMAFDSLKTNIAVQEKDSSIKWEQNEEFHKEVGADIKDIKQSIEHNAISNKSNDSAIMVKINSGDSALNEEIHEMEKNILDAINKLE